jgi:ketosteroid isomerase-like protein
MSQDNVAVVQKLYADFGAGNIPSIIEALAEDVEWSEPPSGVPPFAGTRRGREQVTAFFQSLGEKCEPLQFEPREFIAHGDRVLALGHYRFRARPTGKAWETDWVMVWTFAGGKVTKFQIYKDSAAEVAAFQA